jgi:hypothetical protein
MESSSGDVSVVERPETALKSRHNPTGNFVVCRWLRPNGLLPVSSPSGLFRT